MDAAVTKNNEVLPKVKLHGLKSTRMSILSQQTPTQKMLKAFFVRDLAVSSQLYSPFKYPCQLTDSEVNSTNLNIHSHFLTKETGSSAWANTGFLYFDGGKRPHKFRRRFYER